MSARVRKKAQSGDQELRSIQEIMDLVSIAFLECAYKDLRFPAYLLSMVHMELTVIKNSEEAERGQ